MRRVLIDTGAIYAFVTSTDEHNQAAIAFVRALLLEGGSFVLSDVVFAETMTLLKARLGAAVALRVGRELRRNPVYLWTTLGADGEQNTWTVFQQYSDKQWSYTDCGLFVLARRLKMVDIFAFDRHFDQMPGIVRSPQ